MPVRRLWCLRSAEELAPLADLLAEAMGRQGFSRREVFGMRLALEEAVVNAVKHGHGGDAGKEVRVGYDFAAGEVVVEVEDQGPGFDPRTVPDPLAPENRERDCGRGLFLMRSYLTAVVHNERGNRVTLRLRRGAA